MCGWVGTWMFYSRTPLDGGTRGGGGWILKRQLLGDLPGKGVMPKVPISRRVLIDGLLQVEVPVTE